MGRKDTWGAGYCWSKTLFTMGPHYHQAKCYSDWGWRARVWGRDRDRDWRQEAPLATLGGGAVYPGRGEKDNQVARGGRSGCGR